MIAFIGDHKNGHGVEPICRVLPIAPIDLLRTPGATARSLAPLGTRATR